MSLCVSSKLSKLLSGVWCKCERVIFRFSLSLINWKKETKTQRNVGSVVKSSVKPGLYIKVRHLYLRNTNLNFVHYQNSFSNCSSRTCRMLYTNFNQEKQIQIRILICTLSRQSCELGVSCWSYVLHKSKLQNRKLWAI